MGLAAGTFTVSNGYLWNLAQNTFSPDTSSDPLISHEPSLSLDPTIDREQVVELPAIDAAGKGGEQGLAQRQQQMDKVKNFENEFADDVFLSEADIPLMHSVLLRLKKVEQTVGHGNYNVIGFDDTLKYARYQLGIGRFTREELNFIDKVFNTEAREYGFFGDKVTTELTAQFNRDQIVKVPYTGHFLLKNESLAHYEKLKKDVGQGVILTSGIRSNVKQMHLFMAKAIASNYNLSKASRSLAPPGHSFHGIGDYDVGKIGWGVANFTDRFESTDEFKRMQDLGYVQIRYTKDNRLGVRFEPWHIKVV